MDLNSFSCETFVKLCVFTCLVSALVSPVEAAKKCSRTFSKIPVHKDFNIEKFAGTWYSVTRTTFAWGKDTFDSFSIEITENDDGSFQFSYTGQIGGKCLPVETRTLEEKKKRPGQYVLRDSGQNNDQPTFIVSFTDYRKLALVFFCFKYRPGTKDHCQRTGIQIEIMSRDLNPSKTDLDNYINRAAKRLCVKARVLKPSTAGLCNIAEILTATKQKGIDSKEEDSTSSKEDHCDEKGIPTQENFSLSKFAGTWYTVTRTTFVWGENTFESFSFEIEENEDGSFQLSDTGHAEDKCHPVETGTLEENKNQPGQYFMKISGQNDIQPTFAVSFTDYGKLALVYWCFKYLPGTQNQCQKDGMQIDIMSRDLNPSKSDLDEYSNLADKRLCVKAKELKPTTAGLCNVQEILAAKQREEEDNCVVVNDIPVQEHFSLSEFAGTWYTVTRTTSAWGKSTFESFSIEIGENEDGSFQFSYTGQIGDKCIPVETGTLVEQTKRPGQYVLRVSGQKNDHATFIVSFTDYRKLALVYYCFKYRPGTKKQCQRNGMQIEIMSRDLNPSKTDLDAYKKRASKRLCAKAKMLKPTTAGLCMVPEILAAAKQREIDAKEEDSISSDEDHCAVNDIPVQKDFDASQLHGLWYEIARTRFTFNKMESVVNFHTYDNKTNQIYSYYTGTVDNPEDGERDAVCMSAIQGMSKTVDGATYDSNRLGRIGWNDSTYPWSPTKVLYADDDYILFYACYWGDEDDRCKDEYTEVTLTGRSREISQEKREFIYSILGEICVDAADMTDTKFLANCSSWVTVTLPTKVEPEDCKLDDIQVYEDYISNQMVGTWYLYSSISYNNMTSLNGVVMEKKMALNEGIETRTVAFSPKDDKCKEYFSRSRDMCYDTADHITTLPLGDGHFVFSKVLYLDDEMLVEYTCSALTLDGACDRNGIQFNVYTRNDTSGEEFQLAEETLEEIDQLAESVCLDPNDIELQAEWCNISAIVAQSDDAEAVDCDLDQIEIFGDMGDYVQEEVHGFWYEVLRSSGTSRSSLASAVAYFTSLSNDTLNVYYTGLQSEAVDDEGTHVCSEVLHGSMVTRCRSDIIGDFLYRFTDTESYTSYVPFKILHTDDKMLVTFMCTEMLPSGQCSDNGTEVSIWSRNTTLAEDSRWYAKEMILWKCPEPEMVETMLDNSACRSNLEDYISENQLDISDEEDVDVDNDEESHEDDDENDAGDDDEEEQQRDQGQNKYDLSDIERLLFMDDDEFYNDL